MPAAELTQNFAGLVECLRYIKKKKKQFAGNGKRNALKAIITSINTRTISVNISIIHGDPKRLVFRLIYFSHVNKPVYMYEKVTSKITDFAILLWLSVGRI